MNEVHDCSPHEVHDHAPNSVFEGNDCSPINRYKDLKIVLKINMLINSKKVIDLDYPIQRIVHLRLSSI